jgi:hypothetical protein
MGNITFVKYILRAKAIEKMQNVYMATAKVIAKLASSCSAITGIT